jgi:predicted permease
MRATRVDIAPALRVSSAGGRRRRVWRPSAGQALVVTQVALSLLLLVAAGLFGRTLANLHAIDLGFTRENVLVFTLRPSTVGYEGAALGRFFEDLRVHLGAIGGVQDATLSSRALPMGGGTMAPVEVAGAAVPSDVTSEQQYAALVSVGPDFFGTMQIPLLAGREFSTADRLGAPTVAIVDRQLADVHGIDDPVGRTVMLSGSAYEIVGLVEDSLVFTLTEEPRAAMYLPYLQNERPPGQMTYAIRTTADPLALAAAVREVVRQADARVAIHDLTTLSTHVDQAISTEIALARLSAILAVVTLIVASVGFYGTVAFSVARRTNEIGIRLALGATRTRIVWGVLRDVVALVAVGLVVGLPLVLAGSRYVESLLYGLEPRDPVAIGLAVALLVSCGVAAAFAPARRASRIDPLIAIRTE